MFVKKYQIGCIVILVVSQASSAVAQRSGNNDHSPSTHLTPVLQRPPEIGLTYDHASTALEGMERGQVALLHATGDYWLNVNQALICREQARSLALANKQQWVDYRIGMRTWREGERQRRIAEQRSLNDSRLAAKLAVYRLEDDQLDRTTGAIAWPDLLRAAEYDDLRQRLEELFRARVGYGETTGVNSNEIARCTRILADDLRRNRANIDSAKYLKAQKFLCGLKYEAQMQPNVSRSKKPRTVAGNVQTTAWLTQFK
jgi:hypothetical protein